MRALLALATCTVVLLSSACAHAPAPSSSVGLSNGPSGALASSGPSSLADRAEACFADPTCSVDRAARDFVAADDAGAAPLDCFRFYYGTGVAPDPARARACFARTTRGQTCNGSSPDLDRLYLATMQLDGQGGPVDVRGAEATLAGCFDDVSVSGVRGAKRERADVPIDFCRDIGGTTLSMLECSATDRGRATFARQVYLKSVHASLSERAKASLSDADAAYDAFALADASRSGDEFRGGSLENMTVSATLTTLLEERVERLRALEGTTPPFDLAALELELRERTAATRSDLDAEGAQLFDRAEAAFREYVAKEIAFCIDHGKSADAARALLLRDRIASFGTH